MTIEDPGIGPHTFMASHFPRQQEVPVLVLISTRRKSGDFLASWVITDTDGVSLRAKLDSIAASVSAGFGWHNQLLRGA